MAVSGCPRCSRSMSWLGTLSGTFRKPSMSSENAMSRGRHIGQGFEGLAHPGGARDFAESADMRQAGRAVAGLEQDFLNRLARGPAGFNARQYLRGLLERPGLSSGEAVVFGPGGHQLNFTIKRLERRES